MAKLLSHHDRLDSTADFKIGVLYGALAGTIRMLSWGFWRCCILPIDAWHAFLESER